MFTGTALASICVLLWSFAHRAHMGILKATGILWVPKLSNHQTDLLLITFIGTILPVDVQRHGDFPIGAT